VSTFHTSSPVRQGRELERLGCVDRKLVDLAASLGAVERQYPALIARGALERAEYPRAFPHLLMAAAPLAAADRDPSCLMDRDNLGAPEWILSPAVCFHLYAELAANELLVPTFVTARGRCFRHEADVRPGIRQIEFEMRELVLAGPKEWVEDQVEAARTRIDALAQTLGLAGTWEIAEDPFFLPAARGKALLQRLNETKREYQSRNSDPPGLALASVNRHGSFFGERFGITDRDGQPIHTACLAIGLDRWLYCLEFKSPGETNHVAHRR
jgi:hypothetical protein